MLLPFNIIRSAGVCAAIKTSQLRTVAKKTDITWKTAPYLLWNALEVNIIIIAACIPTLRPLFLVVFKRKGAEAYLKKSYQMTPRSTSGNRWRMVKSAEETESLKSIIGNGKDVPLVGVTERSGNSSGSRSREGTRIRDAEAQKQESKDNVRRMDSGAIMHTTEIQVISYDGGQREAQHIV
ncbi:MAG: hypothetical protein Q9225_004555 [Loekoesia sp. 1 TL-2023]